MARVIQEHIKRPLAEELLFGKLAGGGHVRVEVAADGEGLLLTSEPRSASSRILTRRRARRPRTVSSARRRWLTASSPSTTTRLDDIDALSARGR